MYNIISISDFSYNYPYSVSAMPDITSATSTDEGGQAQPSQPLTGLMAEQDSVM